MKIWVLRKKMESYKLLNSTIVGCFIIFYFFSMLFLFGLPVQEVLLFLLVQLGFIMTGISVVLILKIPTNSISSLSAFGYLFGYAISIVNYFICVLIGNLNAAPYVFGTFCFISILIICFKKNKFRTALNKKTHDKQTLCFLTFWGILYILNTFAYGNTYKDIFSIPHDLSWWMHNSVALKIKFPPDYMIMSGTNLFYHYFSSIQIAISSLITGINVFSLSVPFYTFTKSFLMAGAVYCFVSVFKINIKSTVWMYITILFTTGVEYYSIITYYHHIFFLPFGFDVGFSFGILFFTLLILQYRMDKLHVGIWFGTVLVWSVCVGAKAPIAGVFLMFPGIVCIKWLINRKWRCFLYGGSILTMFILISVFCVGLLGVASGGSSSYYLKIRSLSEVFSFSSIVKTVSKLILAIPTIWFSCAAICCQLIRYKKTFVKLDKDTKLLIGFSGITALWGILLWIIIEADGSSEMYYYMASYIPLYLLLLIMLEALSASSTDIASKKKKRILSSDTIVLTATAFGVFLFVFYSYGGHGAIHDAARSVLKPEIINDESNQLIESLSWLRDNTERNSIVVSDDAVIGKNNKAYAYGIVSERQQYLEGTHMLRFGNKEIQAEISRREEIIQKLYTGNSRDVKQLKSEGVTYIVRTRNLSPNFVENEEMIEKVFENDSVEIYHIQQ